MEKRKETVPQIPNLAEALIQKLRTASPDRSNEQLKATIQEGIDLATKTRDRKIDSFLPPSFRLAMQLLEERRADFSTVNDVLEQAICLLDHPLESAPRPKDNPLEDIRNDVAATISEPPPTMQEPWQEEEHQHQRSITLPSLEQVDHWDINACFEAARNIVNTFLSDLLTELIECQKELPPHDSIEKDAVEQLLQEHIDHMYRALPQQERTRIINISKSRCKMEVISIANELKTFHEEVEQVLKDPGVDEELRKEVTFFLRKDVRSAEDFLNLAQTYDLLAPIVENHELLFSIQSGQTSSQAIARQYIIWNTCVLKLKEKEKSTPRSTPPPRRMRSLQATFRGPQPVKIRKGIPIEKQSVVGRFEICLENVLYDEMKKQPEPEKWLRQTLRNLVASFYTPVSPDSSSRDFCSEQQFLARAASLTGNPELLETEDMYIGVQGIKETMLQGFSL